MLILWRGQQKDGRGYAKTFLKQLERDLGEVAARGVKVVVNAGGLAPAAMAEAVREQVAAAGLRPAGGPRRGRRPAAPHGGADRGRARLHPPRHGAPLRRPRHARADQQRLSRRLGHRHRAGPGRRHRDLPAGHRRRAGRRGRGVALRLGPRRLGPAGRGGGRRARHRVRHAGHRRQLPVLHRDPRPRAPRLPHRRGARRRVVGHHQARGHRRGGDRRHRHRPAALRDRPGPVPQPRRHHPLRHDPAVAGRSGPGADLRGRGRADPPTS